jgi:uncharacterized protein YdhG (YjbR/CyaY superfamily)
MKATKPPTDLQAYLAGLAPEGRKALKQLIACIRAVAPKATAEISYGIPGFRLDGRPLIACAAWKKHVSFYPMTEAIRRRFAAELKGYHTAKGTVQFPLDRPIPVGLAKRLVRARVAEMKSRGR